MRIKIIIPLVLVMGIASTALAVMPTRREPVVVAPISRPIVTAPASLTAPPPAPRLYQTRASQPAEHVRRARLWPQLRAALTTLGDRLERPGRERLLLSGTLTRGTESRRAPLQIIREFPARLRLTEQSGAQLRALTFNRGALEAGEESAAFAHALIESLVLDTAEQFFSESTQGAALRFLGSRVRPDDGSASDYTGPSYDVYEVTGAVRIGDQEHRQTKLFYFNSNTLLLELVRYEANRNGSRVTVETRFSEWQQTDSQQVARLIKRTENGQPVFTVTVTAASFAARAEDGIFGPARDR